ncbi:alpha/beta hydrolase [Aeromicrobium phragmitis]|uniref:Alpha/beta hydrolase n=1 Tax=Aeromicrobium phragmitis TaxID=2478914 RepID=A0A3L8PMZ7_9ACTN|nr:alpha/beta hydrolase [Aeromicrobium phragmitis]RLV56767.1 alpha/beta hydrolase [Aeromicrobium phragmitis]
MNTIARRSARVAGVVVVIGGLFVGLLWAIQRSLIYLPDTTPVGPADAVMPGARDLTLTTSDGLDLTAWLIPPVADADRDIAVLYASGNGGNRAGRVTIAGELAERGFTVLLLDYRGYGGNPGSPSEEGLAADAVAAVDALEAEGFEPARTIYFGESIGTGVVARLQSTRPPAGVLLRSPFPEFTDVAAHHYPFVPVRLLLRDRFASIDHLRGSDVPVCVVYGTTDTIVPPDLSRRVAAQTGNLVDEVPLEGVGHNDAAMFGPPVADAVERLADRAIR